MPDDTRIAEIIAADLDTYTARVRQTEDGGGVFLDNRVLVVDAEPLNRTSFTLLPIGKLPDTEPNFVRHGALPAGKAAAWTGVVVVGGRNTAVQMFRDPIGSTP